MLTFEVTFDSIPLEKFDMGGVLYHANYFHLYELAREQFLKKIGLSYPQLVNIGQHLAIVESHQSFHAPIRYGQPVKLELSFSEFSRTSATFNYRLFIAEQKAAAHTAWTKNVLVQLTDKGFKPIKFPQVLSDAINKYVKN